MKAMMTLNEILPNVYQLPSPDKLKLIRLLAEDLDSSAEDIAPLELNKVYFLATPYASAGAAEILLEELQAVGTERARQTLITNFTYLEITQ